MSEAGRSTAVTTPQQLAARRLLLVGIPLFWSSMYVYNSYLSVYARSLGASLSLVGIIVGMYGFTQLVLRIPIGIASDRWGRRKPFVLLGTLAGAVGCAAMLIAPQPWVLLLGRGLAGTSAACWVTLSVLLVASYPHDQVVRATSVASALSGLGSTLSSMAGGQLAEWTNVRAPFWAGIGLGIVATLLLALIKEPPRPARKPLSVASLLSVGRVPLVLVVSILALFNQYISWAMTQGFVPIYAADLGASKAQLGLLMSTWQGSYALVAFWAGHVAAKLGDRWTVALGFVLITASTLATPLVRVLPVLVALRAVHGIGVGLNSPVLMGGALLAVNVERRGAAMGFYQAIYAIGMVAGPAISGLYADQVGLETTFFVTGLIGLATTVATLFLLPRRIKMVGEGATA
jgi:MFS family permease